MPSTENVPALTALINERENPNPSRRHGAQVTADRLHDHAAKYVDYLTPREMKALSAIIVALDQIPARMRQAGVDE
jgi:hypothetical protein